MVTPGSRARRILAIATAGVLLASLLLVSWHRATVVHRRCVQHDESIELIRVSAASRVVADTGLTGLRAADWVQLGEDAHCAILAIAHVPLTASASVALHHVVVAAELAPRPLAIPARPAAPLYRLAPKTSPPLHA